MKIFIVLAYFIGVALTAATYYEPIIDKTISKGSKPAVIKEIGNILEFTSEIPVRIQAYKIKNNDSTEVYVISVTMDYKGKARTGNSRRKQKIPSAQERILGNRVKPKKEALYDRNCSNNDRNILHWPTNNNNNNNNNNQLNIVQSTNSEMLTSKLKKTMQSFTDYSLPGDFIQKVHTLRESVKTKRDVNLQQYINGLSNNKDQEAKTHAVKVAEFIIHGLGSFDSEQRNDGFKTLNELYKKDSLTESYRQFLQTLHFCATGDQENFDLSLDFKDNAQWMRTYYSTLVQIHPLKNPLSSIHFESSLDLSLFETILHLGLKWYGVQDDVFLSKQIESLLSLISNCRKPSNICNNALITEKTNAMLLKLESYCESSINLHFIYTVRRSYFYEDLSGIRERVRWIIWSVKNDMDLFHAWFTSKEITHFERSWKDLDSPNESNAHQCFELWWIIFSRAEKIQLYSDGCLTAHGRYVFNSLLNKVGRSEEGTEKIRCSIALSNVCLHANSHELDSWTLLIESLLEATNECSSKECLKTLTGILQLLVESSVVPPMSVIT